MKVFKFGGASVKNADAVKNVSSVLKLFPQDNIIVVVSAMGKTTNALEVLTDAFYYKKTNLQEVLSEIKQYHFEIIENLFPDKTHSIYNEITNAFVELDWAIEGEPTYSYEHEYDQIVSLGELISSKIVSAYLNETGVKNKWLDVRDFIRTDNTFREGKVDWEFAEEHVQKKLIPFMGQEGQRIFITQGFIGSTSENFTTTLGREGSDYTAAILAYASNAKDVTIWKDVPGVLNADPKWFDETKKIDQLSYHDAIELSYYGATVIHPKTIKPLQNKKIPLFVKSFIHPEKEGTVISDIQLHLPVPCFIFKVNQVLISLSSKDFSFIIEENLSEVFKILAEAQVKINMMQHTAISFSFCVDQDVRKLPGLIEKLRINFRVLYNDNLELITIRYYDQATIDRVCTNKELLLEQKSRHTVQLVVRNNNTAN